MESEELQDLEAAKNVEKVLIESSNLVDYVGKPVFHAEHLYDQTPVGVVMGLAWIAMGDSTLSIETTQVEQEQGKVALHVTGQLGDVMKESAQIAHTLARAILLKKDPQNTFFANSKLHLHIPAGATPKDGHILAVPRYEEIRQEGSSNDQRDSTNWEDPSHRWDNQVKEKTIAARRSNIKTIIFPSFTFGAYFLLLIGGISMSLLRM